MKKNMKAMLLAGLMVLSLMLFVACEQKEVTPTGPADYKVTVVDAAGSPCSDVLAVKFMKNGQQVAMQLLQDGVATKNLNRDDYKVELQFKNDITIQYTYDQNAAVLSATKTELQIVVSQVLENSVDISVTEQIEKTNAQGGIETETKNTVYKAYYIVPGGAEFDLNPDSKSYFIFMPTEPGSYEVSLVGSDAAIGYYGAMHFVQQTSAIEVKDNKFTLSVNQGHLGGNYVIGVNPGSGKATLVIKRIGEPAWSVEEEPYTEYILKHNPTKYTMPAGTVLKNFDLTASTDTYKLVLDTATGYYHLNSVDGPMIYVRVAMTSAEKNSIEQHTEMNISANTYLPSFGAMLQSSAIRCYFYDADGNFLKKEDYAENLNAYIACADTATGMYPLTDDLIYIIKNQGNQAGWWDLEGKTYIFNDSNGNRIPDINHDIAWLLMCVYAG